MIRTEDTIRYTDAKPLHPWRCPACGGRIHTRRGTFYRRCGRVYCVVDDAVWEKCSRCHDTIMGATLAREIFDLLAKEVCG